MEQRNAETSTGRHHPIFNRWRNRRCVRCASWCCVNSVAMAHKFGQLSNQLRAVLVTSIVFWAIVFVYLVPPIISAVVPLSYWAEFRGIWVENVFLGDPVNVSVDRTINRDFDGKFRVEVRKESGGGFEAFCTRGATDVPYRAESRLPKNITLDWWLGIPPNPPCPVLGVGTYYLITRWEKPWVFGSAPHKELRSNMFRVLDPYQSQVAPTPPLLKGPR